MASPRWPRTSQTLRRLREHAPTPVRVAVRRARTPIWWGGERCDGLPMDRLVRGSILILLDARLGDKMAADVLVHEWAHALAWGRGVTEHGPTFGVL